MEEETEERTDDQQAEEDSEAPAAATDDENGPTEDEKADQEAIDEVAALEGDPPQNLEDWPDGAAKYKTFGGPDGDQSWDEGATSELGDSDVRHNEDGSVTVKGEKVDNPDEYKGDPIPGGPTDPEAPKVAGEKDLTKEGSKESDSNDDDSGDSSSEESNSEESSSGDE